MLKISSIDLQQIQFEENFANLSIIVFLIGSTLRRPSLLSFLNNRHRRSSIGIDEERTDEVHFRLHQFGTICRE